MAKWNKEEKNKGLIIVTMPKPGFLFPKIAKRLGEIQKASPGYWSIYTVYNKDNKEPNNLKDKIRYYTENLNEGRKTTLEGGFSYMLNIDSDTLAPIDTIPEMLSSNSDVAVGICRLKQPPHRINCFKDRGDGGIKEIELKDRFVPLYRFGSACILIKRRVLKKVKFELDFSMGPDFRFAKDCLEKGFRCVACTRVRCEHILGNGKVLKV